MTKNEFYFMSADRKTKIHAVEWLPDGKPAAVLQISHGVTEYILRYEALAEYFTQKGFVVVGNDHLGHGMSVDENSEPMYFGPEGSWKWVVKDMHTCKKLTGKNYKDLPYFLLGFSLGSFAARTYLIKYSGMVDAAILIGTGQINRIAIALARFMADREARRVGEEYSSPMIKKLTFESYNRNFAPNRTEFDWLCSDEKSLDSYISDPMRGGNLSAGLFRELLDGMAFSGSLKNVRRMNMDAPILLLSGDRDPVGNNGKGVIRTYKLFKRAGIKNVKMKMYPTLRHDILNENCRQDIYDDIYKWLREIAPV